MGTDGLKAFATVLVRLAQANWTKMIANFHQSPPINSQQMQLLTRLVSEYAFYSVLKSIDRICRMFAQRMSYLRLHFAFKYSLSANKGERFRDRELMKKITMKLAENTKTYRQTTNQYGKHTADASFCQLSFWCICFHVSIDFREYMV